MKMWFPILAGHDLVWKNLWKISIFVMLLVGLSGCFNVFPIKNDGETDSANETGTGTETAGCTYECMSETACTKVVGGTVHFELTCSNKTDVCCEPPSGKDTNTVVDANTDADTSTTPETDTNTDADTVTDMTPQWPSEVTPDHIASGVVSGTLLAIDVPYVPALPATGGPDWPGTADDGFTTVNSPLREVGNETSPWEPDGTPLREAKGYRVYGGDNPSAKYVFGLPDGTVINAVYATWNTRTRDGCTYSYAEGPASDFAGIMQDVEPADSLVLSWTDNVSVVREGNFQRLFIGPITVEGGDGFELWAWDNLGNAANVDAIALDVSP